MIEVLLPDTFGPGSLMRLVPAPDILDMHVLDDSVE